MSASLFRQFTLSHSVSFSPARFSRLTATENEATRRLIDRHLTFVNYLPTATVDGGDSSGHGEGTAHTNLNTFE
jgi:hypothetical protein